MSLQWYYPKDSLFHLRKHSLFLNSSWLNFLVPCQKPFDFFRRQDLRIAWTNFPCFKDLEYRGPQMWVNFQLAWRSEFQIAWSYAIPPWPKVRAFKLISIPSRLLSLSTSNKSTHRFRSESSALRWLSTGVANIQHLYFRYKEIDLFLPHKKTNNPIKILILLGGNYEFHPGNEWFAYRMFWCKLLMLPVLF